MKKVKPIEIFKTVRDLPYEIGPAHEGEVLLQYGRGGCGAKNRYLAQYFYENGFQVKVCWTEYRWQDLGILPEKIKNHPNAKRVGHHVYVKVKINNRWILIDASWDRGLCPVLPVNFGWDGKSDQMPAVQVKHEQCLAYPEPYITWRKKNKKPIKITNKGRGFARLMNDWFESIRKR